MIDYTLKAETGAYGIKLGEPKVEMHKRLPPDHPIHALVGRVAADWAMVEHLLDITIWHLTGLSESMGACLTGQIMGSYGRMATIHSLCLHRNLDEKILKRISEITRSLKGSQDRRNGILHDAWYFEHTEKRTEQFKSMARDEWLFGFHAVDEAFLHETLDKIARRIVDVTALREMIYAATPRT
jgi:hypothetical protein